MKCQSFKTNTVLIFVLPFYVFSQRDSIKAIPSGNIFFEFLGPGYLYSLNYEKIVHLNLNSSLNLRLGGAAYLNRGNKKIKHSFFPISTTFTLKKRNKLSYYFGLGITYVLNTPEANWPNYSPCCNYYPKERIFPFLEAGLKFNVKSLFFKLAYYPMLLPPNPGSFYKSSPVEKAEFNYIVFGASAGKTFYYKRK